MENKNDLKIKINIEINTKSQHFSLFKKKSQDKSHSLPQCHKPWFVKWLGFTICQLELSWYMVEFDLLFCHQHPNPDEEMSHLNIFTKIESIFISIRDSVICNKNTYINFPMHSNIFMITPNQDL